MGKSIITNVQKAIFWIKRGLSRKKEANAAIDTFMGKEIPEKVRRMLRPDMYEMRRSYHYNFDEYLLFHFEKLTLLQRLEYVSDKERFIFSAQINPSENKKIFKDKYLTYQKFKPFYHREVLLFKHEDGEQTKFDEFWQNHNSCIVKPYDGTFGRGIKVFRKEAGTSSGQMFQKICSLYPERFVVEELVVQSGAVAVFHPQSVNTLRVTTFNINGNIEILFAFLRAGQGEAVVDNAGSGGIACPVDLETGTIMAAMDKHGVHYEKHPDSSVQLIGAKIERFDEACELAKKLATVIPSNCYTAWDLALTDEGWVMIEGNYCGQCTAWQAATHTALRHRILDILARNGFKEKPICG